MTASILSQALAQVFDPYVLWVILGSAIFGLFVGAVPGLTATMATALLVPVTFGAVVYEGVNDVLLTGLPPGSAGPFIVGMLTASVTALTRSGETSIP